MAELVPAIHYRENSSGHYSAKLPNRNFGQSSVWSEVPETIVGTN